MKKIISIVASLALVTSLVGAPGLAFAATSSAANTEFNAEVSDVPNAKSENSNTSESTTSSAVAVGTAAASTVMQAAAAVTSGDVEAFADDDAEDLTLQETLLAEARATEKTSTIQLNFDSYLPDNASALDLEMKLEARSASARTQPPVPLVRKADAQNGATTSFYAVKSGIPAGTYSMSISGTGHALYTQDITIAAGKKAVITLIDSLVSDGVDLSCTDDKRLVGLQAYGDYNLDGVVDSQDSRHLVEVLASVSSPNATHIYDFNGDGLFDLDDIQFFATTVKKTNDGIARCGSVRTTLDTSNFVVTPGSDTDISSSDGSSDPTWGIDDGTTAIIENKDGSPIDKDHPVEITIETEGGHYQGIIIHSPLDDNGDPRNMPTDGFVVVYPEGEPPFTLPFSSPDVKVDPDTGQVIIDFGEPLDVEKVVITITETSGPDPDKAEISYIEFIEDQAGLDDVFALDVPANLRAQAEKSAFTVDWDGVSGATSYMLRVTGPDGTVETKTLSTTTLRVIDLDGSPIVNEQDYTVEVRALGTNARSPWSDPITVTPTALVVPDTPTGLTLKAATYSSLSVEWDPAANAATYEVYYKEKGSAADPSVVKDIAATNYTITGLKMGTEYEIYVVARNVKGPSKAPSSTITVSTDQVDVKVPWYNLINETVATLDPADKHTTVIATTPADATEAPGYASDMDRVIDGDYKTFFHQDETNADPAGQTFEFDDTYPINCFAYTTRLDTGYDDIKDVTITIWDAAGTKVGEYSTADKEISVRPLSGADSTFFIMFPESNVKRMQILMTREDGKPVTCSEVAFYESDHLDRYVESLFKDETQSSLNDLADIKAACTPAFDGYTSVKDIIDQLKKDIERTDPVFNEKIPDIRYDDLKRALDKASELVEFEADGTARPARPIDPAIIPASDDNPDLSALQPVGVTAKPGDQIEIYVAATALASGAETPLRVVATQFDGHNGSWKTTLKNTAGSSALKVGLNTFEIPVIDSTISSERGGALYIENLGSPIVQSYSVRIKGGIDTASLDVRGITDAQEREAACKEYVNALKLQQEELSDPNEPTHKKHEHGGAYDADTCIANATDIASDTLLLSLPSTVALSSIQKLAGSNNPDQMAHALSTALSNMDRNMDMLYQQKGMARTFTENELTAYGKNNYIPTARVNIRYMRYDTAKQVMYAGDGHVGIKREQCNLLEDGKFSWDLLHEIGHIIADASYEIDEVTPSYFALLTTTPGPDGSGNVSNIDWPFTYEDVYEHLVKTTKVSELPDDLALALMWQLHLAFDGQPLAGAGSTGVFDESIYARMGIFARNLDIAPAPQGIQLSLNTSSTWDSFIRLACAAANENLLPFFDAWGIVYDTNTLAYAGQFSKSGRPIQYVTDVSSRYMATGGTAAAGQITQAEAVGDDGSTDKVPLLSSATGTNEMKVTFAADLDENDILGYQLTRNGRVCAFIPADPTLSGLHTVEYTDYLTQGNINYAYEVCAVDKLFNATIKLNLGSMKLVYSGQQVSNNGWSAQTNVSTTADNTSALISRVMNPCEPFTRSDAAAAVDGDANSAVSGTASEGNAQFTIRMKDEANVFGLKYTAGPSNAIDDFIIETSLNGSTWTKVADGTFESTSGIAYFTQSGNGVADEAAEAHIYHAGYVRLTANGQSSASAAEIELFGPLDDNISFFLDKASMGKPDEVTRGGCYAREGLNEGTVTIHPSYLAFVGDIVGQGDDIVLALYDQNGDQLIGSSIYRFVHSTGAPDSTPRFWVYYFDDASKPDADCQGNSYYVDSVWYPTLRSVTVKMYRANGATSIDDMVLVSEHRITNPASFSPASPTNVAPALRYIHNADTPVPED